MAVTGNEPVSVGDIAAILPLPINAGGTGSTTAADAIVALGIDEFVQQAVENYEDIKSSIWQGSASYDKSIISDTFTFTLSQTENSKNITMTNNQIHVDKAGTYRFSGSLDVGDIRSTSGRGCTLDIKLSTGQVLHSEHFSIKDGGASYEVLKSVTFSSAKSFSIMGDTNGGSMSTDSIGITNIMITRIA